MALLDRFRAFRSPRVPTTAPVPLGEDTGSLGTIGETSAYVDTIARALAPLLRPTRGITHRHVDAMRLDPMISACATAKALSVIRAQWFIRCDDPQMVEDLTAAYAIIGPDLHRSMARAILWGHSPNTLRWDVDPTLGMIVPTRVRDLPAASVEALVDDAGNYAGLVQHRGQKHEEVLDGEDVLLTLWVTENMESGNLYGRSSLTPALEPWQDYIKVRLFNLRALERFGEPAIIGRAPSGDVLANAREIAAAQLAGETPPAPEYVPALAYVQRMGEDMRHHSVVSLPSEGYTYTDPNTGRTTNLGPKWGLELLQAEPAGEAFREDLARLDRAKARGMFIPSLLMENGETGAYALGKEHRSIYDAEQEARLEDYGRQNTRHLIDRMRLFNYGDGAPHASIEYVPPTNEERAKLWELALLLIKGGGNGVLGERGIDAEALADSLDIPLGDVIEAQEAVQGDGGEEQEEEPEEEEPEVQASRERIHVHAHDAPAITLAVDTLPEWQLPQGTDEWRRDPNDREPRAMFAALDAGMNRAERATIDALSGLLDKDRERLLRQVRGIMGKGSEAEVTAAMGTLSVSSATPYANAWKDLVLEVWTLGLSSLVAQLPAAYAGQVPDTIGATGRALARVLGDTSAERWTTKISTDLRLDLLNALASGVTLAGMEALVNGHLDRELRSEARPLRLGTRMLSTRGVNEARQDGVERGKVPLLGVQFSALLDRRVCALCERLDEATMSITHSDFGRFTPPLHHNCRCVWIYITTGEEGFTPDWQTPPQSLVDSYGSLVIG